MTICAADPDVHADFVFKLLRLYEQICSGSLDGKPFTQCSARSLNKQAFEINGWVDVKRGPVLRFSAPWGRLGEGEILMQYEPKADWAEVVEESAAIDFKSPEIVLQLGFKTDDGQFHCAEFTTFMG